MKKYSAKNYASNQVIGITGEEARDIRYALSVVQNNDQFADLDIDVKQAKEILEH